MPVYQSYRAAIACQTALCWLVGLACLIPAGRALADHPAAWLREAKWGVMSHYLADWIARRQRTEMTVERWNAMVDRFDVERLADQLDELGAGYYVLTIGQNSGYYVSPNETYDRLVGVEPSRCSRRDLVADVSRALAERGIPLLVYLPAGAPARDHVAVEALDWRNGPHRNREFQEKWESVISEWSIRWGDGVAGWWFDGCYWANAMYRHADLPNFASFAAAARAGNPRSIVAFNQGVFSRINSITPHEDYTAGEINDPAGVEMKRVEGGLRDGAQTHVLSYLGRTWGMGDPRFSEEQVVRWSRRLWEQGAAVTWDAPTETQGVIAAPSFELLKAVGAAARDSGE